MDKVTTTKKLIDKMKSLLDPEWEKLKPNPVPQSNEVPNKWWMYYISPPFPSIWPPKPNLRLYYYAYAQGLDFTGGLVDAVYIAASWARVKLDIKGNKSPELERLSNRIEEIGIQGIRPLSEEEMAIFEKGASAQAFLGNLTTLPDRKEQSVSELIDYYCTWLRLNAAIASDIRSFHEAFFKWLQCD